MRTILKFCVYNFALVIKFFCAQHPYKQLEKIYKYNFILFKINIKSLIKRIKELKKTKCATVAINAHANV